MTNPGGTEASPQPVDANLFVAPGSGVLFRCAPYDKVAGVGV